MSKKRVIIGAIEVPGPFGTTRWQPIYGTVHEVVTLPLPESRAIKRVDEDDNIALVRKQ